MKIAQQEVWAICSSSENLPWHGIQLVLNFLGHLGIVIIVLQDDAISEFTTFILDHDAQF